MLHVLLEVGVYDLLSSSVVTVLILAGTLATVH